MYYVLNFGIEGILLRQNTKVPVRVSLNTATSIPLGVSCSLYAHLLTKPQFHPGFTVSPSFTPSLIHYYSITLYNGVLSVEHGAGLASQDRERVFYLRAM